MRCEICGKNATGVCPRCYRFICEKCSDPITLECIDCSSIKRLLEENYLKYIEILRGKLSVIENKIDECLDCPLLKDSVMSNLRRIKELENWAKLESLERLYEDVKEIKEKAQSIAVKYLVKIKMRNV